MNDSLTISKERLDEHNDLVKDIHLIWQYSPKQQIKESPQMKDMQAQISELKLEIERIKSKNNNN